MGSVLQEKVLEALTPKPSILHDDLFFWKPFEKAPIVYYIRFFEDLACKVNIQSLHEPQRVQEFLREITAESLSILSPESPILLSPIKALDQTLFQKRALLHSSICEGSLSRSTEFMAKATYTAFPIYACEFTEDDTSEEAQFRRAKVIPWSNWNREPYPWTTAIGHSVME